MVTMNDKISPTHPGEVLLEDFLKPLEMSANALAMALRVPVSRISGIIHCERAVTGDTALRLSRYFGTTPDFWMRLQAKYDLEIAKDQSEAAIARDVQPRDLLHA